MAVTSCISSTYSSWLSDIILSEDKERLCSVGFSLTSQLVQNYLKCKLSLTSSAVSTFSVKAFIACSAEHERWSWHWRQRWINSKQKLHLCAQLAVVMQLLDFVLCQQDETPSTAHTHTLTAANLHPLSSVWNGWKHFDLRHFTKDERGLLDKVFFWERNITLTPVWFSEHHNGGREDWP